MEDRRVLLYIGKLLAGLEMVEWFVDGKCRVVNVCHFRYVAIEGLMVNKEAILYVLE